MSEHLARDPGKQAKLKEIIGRLHGGAAVAEVKRDFNALIKGVSAEEVAAMEQALVDEGFPVEEIQRLCEVHVAVFESSLEKGRKPSRMPGHPVHSFMAENRAAERLARRLLRGAWAWAWGFGSGSSEAGAALGELSRIAVHYARKENQLFPYLERHGFTGPSKVMWGKHDEIRAKLKEAEAAYREASGPEGARRFLAEARRLAAAVRKMVFMEERILYPNALKRLSEREWAEIRKGEEAIGFAWIEPGAAYDADLVLSRLAAGQSAEGGAAQAPAPAATPAAPHEGLLELNTGRIGLEVLDLALRALPLDFSVVDENDRVLYYSDAPERIFPRSPAVIGRAVQNCHPQKSVAVVESILSAFKKKEKSQARFWIEMGGKFVVIEYKALYDQAGRYRGCLETTMDAAPYRGLSGERRLLDWS